MRLLELNEGSRCILRDIVRFEDEQWNDCKHWWEPESKSGPAVEDMRRWHATYNEFRNKLLSNEDIGDALTEWVGLEEADRTVFASHAYHRMNVPQSRFCEAYVRAVYAAENAMKAAALENL
jgi:hypothetical protein